MPSHEFIDLGSWVTGGFGTKIIGPMRGPNPTKPNKASTEFADGFELSIDAHRFQNHIQWKSANTFVPDGPLRNCWITFSLALFPKRIQHKSEVSTDFLSPNL